jgi:hypothetical protein
MEQVGKDNPNITMSLSTSFIELYNEEIRDMLVTGAMSPMQVREDPQKGVHIPGLTEIECKTRQDLQNCLARGTQNRTVGIVSTFFILCPRIYFYE